MLSCRCVQNESYINDSCFINLCTFTSLQRVSFMNCSITKKTIQYLLHNNQSVKSLKIIRCKFIDDTVFDFIRIPYLALSELVLEPCYYNNPKGGVSFTRIVVRGLVEKFPNLENIGSYLLFDDCELKY